MDDPRGFRFVWYVRWQKILSLAFMHSSVTCSVSKQFNQSYFAAKKRQHLRMELMLEVLLCSTWRSVCGAV